MEPEFKSISLDLKTLEGDSPNGEFEAVLSTPDLDREGESVQPGAFQPLPKSIPIHFDHDFVDKVPPIGRGVPFYDGDVLKVRGSFASTPRAQELRSLVNEGVIDSMSAGFLTTKRKGKSVITADLIEGSLTATPVNRSALLLRSKSLTTFTPEEVEAALDLKAGARNSASDAQRIQSMHDTATELGATCSGTKALDDLEAEQISEEEVAATDAAEKSVTSAATASDDESNTLELRARLLQIDAEVAAT